MERVLLDTSVLIDLWHGVEPVSTTIRHLLSGDTDVCICAVVVSEFIAGVRPESRGDWDAFFETLRFLPTTSAAAHRAGAYRFDFKCRGRTIATADALIAAVARDYGAILLTENPKHFPMDDIEVRSFRS